MTFDFVSSLIAGVAALVAGLINALAGGGTLISFPVLTALGVPAVAANVTNCVALTPGFFGGILAQRRDLEGQAPRLWIAVPASAIGGLAGGMLLLWSDERVFLELVPWLILIASALVAAQEPLRRWLLGRGGAPDRGSYARIALPLALASIYGGYFGAGLSVVVLAGLGLAIHDSLTRLNALKQAVALTINITAGVFFLFSGQVVWPFALIMSAGALVGGAMGGGLATRIDPARLRQLVVGIGCVVATIYFLV